MDRSGRAVVDSLGPLGNRWARIGSWGMDRFGGEWWGRKGG